jgi:hypothetical protein
VKIRGEDKFKSPIGGLFTIIYVILGILAFIAFGRDLFDKNLPTVTYNKELTKEAQFTLTSENYAVAFVNQIDTSAVENFERKFNLYANVFRNYPNSSYTSEKFILQKCDLEMIKKKPGIINMVKEEYYCFPKGTNITATGVYGGDTMYVGVRVNLDYCINGVDNKSNCLSKESTALNMKNMIMHIIFDEFYANPYNYADPFNKMFYANAILGQAGTFARQVIDFKRVDYKTDRGFILQEIDTQSQNSVDTESVTYLVNPATTTLYSHMYRNSKWREIYKRTYIKIQGVFALIGGFLSLITIILKLVCRETINPDILHLFYQKYKEKENQFEEALTEEHKVKNNKSSKHTKAAELSKPVELTTYNNLSPTPTPNATSITNRSEAKKMVKGKKKEKRPSVKKIEFLFEGMSFFNKLFRFSCFKTKRFKIECEKLDTINKIFIKKFSLEHIMKVSRKVKLIDHIVFEDYQRKLLKYVGLPESDKSESSYMNLHKKLKNNLDTSSGNNVINKNLLFCLQK